MTIERLSSAIVFFGSIVFCFWVLPQQIEAVDYGRVLPTTVPTIATWTIMVCSGIQCLGQTEAANLHLYSPVRTLLIFVLIVSSVYLMNFAGFEYCAPVLALSLMLFIGERNWRWLLLGSIIVPLGTWLLVEQMLGRPLA